MGYKKAIGRLKKQKIAIHRADVNIGKNGLHENVVNEIKRRLELEGVIKIRILKSARQYVSEDDIYQLARNIDAIVADVRGYTYVLISKKALKGNPRKIS
ncbi:protein of unknown function UPF0044 [Ignisphaera aggregans DSM 17230]|uniref:CRM domain-containing protein n=1 Tax=Ignisphaera aggregans (strain DSM 17230 / JCM 13409 / AQ1.S1) TaxID=583356 RepID=E0SQF4_IGNAA|nr:protein of unknown function UPF0044 [Ignisphaera aggregans DSM 17230]